MVRKPNEGTGTLPGLDDDSRPSRRRARASVSGRTQFFTRNVITWTVISFASLMALLYGFYRVDQFLTRDPRFTLTGTDGLSDAPAIDIAGVNHASRRQIERVFAIDLGRSVYQIPLAERRNMLRTVDWIREASIVRLWPNRIVVSVIERTPVAFLALSSTKFAMIDDEGVVLPTAADRFTLPVLSGVRLDDSAEDRRDRVRRMMRLMKDLAAAAQDISGIDVSDPDNLTVTQLVDGRVVTLLFGDHDFADRYQNFIRHYPEIKQKRPKALRLDLRLDDRITVVE
jgi:cell division protein FtsQ